MGRAKREFCKRGHLRSPENLNNRACKECARMLNRGRTRIFTEEQKLGRQLINRKATRKYSKTERRKESTRRWKEAHPDRVRDWHIRSVHGISSAEYDARKAAQNNLCAACKKPFSAGGSMSNKPVLDHNHKNNELREFIHGSCNVVLGLVDEDPVTLRLLAEYLERHQGKIK